MPYFNQNNQPPYFCQNCQVQTTISKNDDLKREIKKYSFISAKTVDFWREKKNTNYLYQNCQKLSPEIKKYRLSLKGASELNEQLFLGKY